MNIFRIVLLIIILAIGLPSHGTSAESPVADQDEVNAQLLSDGSDLLIAGRPKEAIEYFEKAAVDYEEKYKNDATKIFCARSEEETMLYLLQAAINKDGNTKVVSADWAYAYYMKAIALIDLGKLSEAKVSMERALTLSPSNSVFLSGLGHIYQYEKNWPMALQIYQRAEEAANAYSPPESRNVELSRAWRGIGYVYVELNKIDEAEKMFRQCLELDKYDQIALKELRYVQDLRAKSGGR